MGWSNADQPFEYTLPEGRMAISNITEFFTIPSVRDVVEAPEEAVYIITVD